MKSTIQTLHPARIIARKELRESFRDGRFRLLAVAILALLAAGLAAGWLDTRESQRAIDAARAADHATWLGQGPRNPHSAAHFGHYAFKPRPALSALDRGVDGYLGTAVWLEAHWQDPFALRPAEDRTALQRFGELSAAFTLQVLAPLLIIFLGFGAFAGERERGTLRQLASLGLEARTLALGKALGLGAALALVLVPAVLLGAGVRAVSPVPSRLDFITAMRAASSDASKASAELLAQYYHEHPELAANGQQGGFLPAYYASERDVEQRLEPLTADFERRLDRQQELVGRWRFASPAVLAQETLIELAGSSLHRHRRFRAETRAFLAQWHGEMAPRIFRGEHLEPEIYDHLPSFTFAEPPVSRSRFIGAVLGLTLPSLLALAAARRRLDGFSVTP